MMNRLPDPCNVALKNHYGTRGDPWFLRQGCPGNGKFCRGVTFPGIGPGSKATTGSGCVMPREYRGNGYPSKILREHVWLRDRWRTDSNFFWIPCVKLTPHLLYSSLHGSLLALKFTGSCTAFRRAAQAVVCNPLATTIQASYGASR